MRLLKGLALPRGDWPLVVAGALLLALAYPPFHLLIPSFLCVVPVVWLLHAGQKDARPLRRHLVQGLWYGLLSQGLVLYWMVVALWHFTRLSAAGYAATVLILALYNALLFALTGWVTRRTKLPMIVVLPLLWTAVEWCIGHQGDIRFPWLGLGTSLTGYPVLVQMADVIGARGVTFLLVMANAALATAWLERTRPRAVLRLFAVSVGVLAALAYGDWRMRTLPLRVAGDVALIQPNVGYREKWDSAYTNQIMADLFRLSHEALDSAHVGLVAWPEAAVPAYFPDPQVEAPIGALAREYRTPFLVGAVDVRWYGPGPRDYDYWNAAFLFDSTGSRAGQPVYHKHYLVPITERVPFVNPRWFKNIKFFGGFSVGALGDLFHVGMGQFGVLICYEDVFENLARRYRAMGAEFLVNITNDAWFGETSAPRQHIAHLVMRAIENRIGVARAANTGISGFVDPLGRIYDTTPLDVQRFVVGPLVTSDARTLYTRLGDWVGLLSLVGSLMVLGFAWWRRR